MKKILFALTVVSSLFLTSCSKDDEGKKEESTSSATSITVSSDNNSIGIGETLTLSSATNEGFNVTASSQFYVNGTLITGNTYVPNALGTIEIYSTYTPAGGTQLTSTSIQVNVVNAILFNKRVLIEDFTGTWCGYCPRVAYAIDLVKQETSNVVPVAIHRSGDDPWDFGPASALEDQVNLQGYPHAMLDRNTKWAYPETSTSGINQAVSMTNGVNPKLGVAMENTTSGSTSTVKVKVKFGKDFSNLKLVVYALENGLIRNQSNYTTYYGGGNPIVNFEHNHVVRAVLTSSILGENITGSTLYDQEYTKTFTYNIPSSVNSSNLEFVAFVIDGSNKSLNARLATSNETQTFEIQ